MDGLSIMSRMTTFRDIIDLWPSRIALADDISRGGRRVSAAVVHKWAQRNRIPAEHDLRLAQAAAERGLPVDLEALASVRARRGEAA